MAQCLGFADEAVGEILNLLRFGFDDFEGDQTVESFLPGAVNRTHAALADQVQDFQLRKRFDQFGRNQLAGEPNLVRRSPPFARRSAGRFVQVCNPKLHQAGRAGCSRDCFRIDPHGSLDKVFFVCCLVFISMPFWLSPLKEGKSRKRLQWNPGIPDYFLKTSKRC